MNLLARKSVFPKHTYVILKMTVPEVLTSDKIAHQIVPVLISFNAQEGDAYPFSTDVMQPMIAAMEVMRRSVVDLAEMDSLSVVTVHVSAIAGSVTVMKTVVTTRMRIIVVVLAETDTSTAQTERV